jgi:hypothetical protein
LRISCGVIRSQLILYFVLVPDVDLFVVYPRVVEWCPWFAFFLHCRSPVNFFALSSAGIVGSGPARSMDVCVRLFCVYVLLCVGGAFAAC